ncbi:MAG: hypothetical protein PHN69_03950 [Candidatus Pacebacteria bacterium]|nr:hypothetical protein [Candidatus Paceibacterota bacterium]
MSKIEHEHTDEIVCPYCGDKWADSYDCDPREGDLGLQDCYECGKQFYATRHIEVTYSSSPAEIGVCKHCGETGVIEDHCSSIGEYNDLCVQCGEKEKRRLIKEYFDRLEREDKYNNV